MSTAAWFLGSSVVSLVCCGLSYWLGRGAGFAAGWSAGFAEGRGAGFPAGWNANADARGRHGVLGAASEPEVWGEHVSSDGHGRTWHVEGGAAWQEESAKPARWPSS